MRFQASIFRTLLLLILFEGFFQIFTRVACTSFGNNMFPSPFLTNFTFLSTYIEMSKTFRPNALTKSCIYLTIPVKSALHTFCLTVSPFKGNSITDESFIITVLGSSESDSEKFSLEDMNITVARGYDVEMGANYVDGYIQDNRFYGKVFVNKRVYFIELFDKIPYTEVFSKNAIMYDISDVFMFYNISNIASMYKRSSYQVKPYVSMERGLQEKTFKGRVCELLLVADHFFLRDVGLGNISKTVTFLLRSAEMADIIFRNTDFDGDGQPDNIGFRIKHIIILRANSPQNHFSDISENVTVDGREILLRLGLYSMLSRVCMGALYTSLRLKDRTLGLSYTATSDNGQNMQDNMPQIGGICERPIQSGHSTNVLGLTVTTQRGDRVPELASMITFAHELGHSFGSSHDDKEKCGVHLMSPTSLNGTVAQMFKFSACSIAQMKQVIASKGFCFVEELQTFCGNGLVETGEECDCGLPIDCQERDLCCIPRGRHGACHVDRSREYTCHPSQGWCCLNSCHYRNLSDSDLNCTEALSKTCPCADGNEKCPCGHHSSCLEASCHSNECILIGLTECACPNPQPNCQTCCLLRGGCIHAAEATNILVSDGNISVHEISRRIDHLSIKKRGHSSVNVSVCDSNMNCVNVLTRVWHPGSWCVLHGHLGRCLKTGVCDTMPKINRATANFPEHEKLQSVSMSVRLVPAFSSTKTELIVFMLCLVILL